MQTNCPNCSQPLVVEDDKIPAGPFMLRCPKCQNALKLPGKGSTPKPAASQTEASAPPPTSPGSPGTAVASAATPPKAAPPASIPPPQGVPAAPQTSGSGENGRALVFLSDGPGAALQQSVAALLQANGYGIDIANDVQQGIQLLERTSYALVVTTANGSSGGAGDPSLYKRVVALAPEIRRNVFLVLLGSDFSSGDGPQAFAAMADLVLHPKDVPHATDLLQSTVNERARIFQAFVEAQARLDRRKY